MNNAELARQLDLAGNALKAAALAAANGTTPSPPDGAVTTPAELDAALAKADAGATIRIAPTLVYDAPLALAKPVTLMNAAAIVGRASLGISMPSFRQGMSLLADNVSLYALEARHNVPDRDIVVLAGAHVLLDGCRVLGSLMNGAKRGIQGNAPDVHLVRNYVEDCYQLSPGYDSQAFCAWDSPGPFLLEDNYFSGGSETVLFGGADSSSAANVPSNIVLRGNTITKRSIWQGQPIGVKNCLELKAAINVLVEDNDISYAWAQGQDGYLIVITPRNQDGSAPWSTVRNVTIRNNRLAHGAGVMSMLGSDNDHPSGSLADLTFEDNDCSDIDGTRYGTGNNKLFLAVAGPQRVTISGNKVAGARAGSALYFDVPPKCPGFVFIHNTLPPSDYGIMGGGCAPDPTLNNPAGGAWSTFVAGGTIGGNVEGPA